jgi:FMN phosphatase YigB (HAD superfamily)
VGDSWREDVEGASQAGMQSWLIARDQKIVTEGEHEFGRLAQLTELLAWAL